MGFYETWEAAEAAHDAAKEAKRGGMGALERQWRINSTKLSNK